MHAEQDYLIRHALHHDSQLRMRTGAEPERHAWALEFLKTTLFTDAEKARHSAEMAMHARLACRTGSPASQRALQDIERHYLEIAYRRAIRDARIPEAVGLANQLAGIEGLSRRDRSEALLRVSTALRNDWQLESAIETAQRAMEAAEDERQQAWARHEMANAQMFDRKLEEAEANYQLALRGAQDVNDQRLEASALCNMGSLRRQQGRGEEAGVHYRRAIEVAREAGARDFEGTAHLQLGYLLSMTGKITEAEAEFKLALDVLHETPKALYRVDACSNLGDLAQRAGNFQQAEHYLELAMATARGLGYRAGLAQAMNYGAMLYDAMGRGDDAVQMLRDAIEISCEAGDQMNIGYGLANLGAALLDQGRLDEAEQAFEQAMQAGALARNPYIEGAGHNGIGDIRRKQTRLMEAWTSYEHASHLMDMAGYAAGALRANIKLAALTHETGDAGQAAPRLKELQNNAREGGLRDEFELASVELARALEALEDFTSAVTAWEQAAEAADGTPALVAIQVSMERCRSKAGSE